MSRQKNKPAARQERRASRPHKHEPFIRLVQQEETFRTPSVKASKALIEPMNDAQRAYDAAMRSSAVSFGIGPAGTGKTWLAVMRAAEALERKEIEKIVLTRPAVEAGESLGFLPGELEEKYEPYIRPVRDALEEKFGTGYLEYLLKAGIIEARPLAFLRGSTLKNCWVIADEMQNATKSQFKMLLSRIGEGAKFVVNGDPGQCDLDPGLSGLLDATKRLEHIGGISVVTFTRADIVRSGICQQIVEAYESSPNVSCYNDEHEKHGLHRTLAHGDNDN